MGFSCHLDLHQCYRNSKIPSVQHVWPRWNIILELDRLSAGQQQLQRGGESTDTDEFQGEFTIEVGDRAFTIGLLDTVKQALAKEGGTFAYTLHVPVA